MGRRKTTKSDADVAKPTRITNEQRKDWRNLDTALWNTLTFTVYFTERNAELYGVEYVPMRNWSFEQALIKRNLERYGPEILRQAFEECFRDYKPTREYPLLTAGFAIGYRINTLIPRLVAEKAREDRAEASRAEGPNVAELEAWL